MIGCTSFDRLTRLWSGQSHYLSIRQARTIPLLTAFGDRSQGQRLKISAKYRPSEKLNYIHTHRDGLQTFLHDGRVEIDSKRVENLIRPIALNRKMPSSPGMTKAESSWGRIASLIETCKVNAHRLTPEA